jgi:hypothetical protein
MTRQYRFKAELTPFGDWELYLKFLDKYYQIPDWLILILSKYQIYNENNTEGYDDM